MEVLGDGLLLQKFARARRGVMRRPMPPAPAQGGPPLSTPSPPPQGVMLAWHVRLHGQTWTEDAAPDACSSTFPMVRPILRDIQPVSLRAEGLLNDSALAGNPQPMELERIVAPTFVASVGDDRFETAAAARHIASSVPGAQLVIYPSGGHVWVGHNDDLFARIDAFLRKHDPAFSAAHDGRRLEESRP